MSRTSNSRVLVVDNLADAADCLAILLGLWGYDAEVCYDGATALEIAPNYAPMVVLLDIGMPGMDGFEVSRRLRDQPAFAATVIIALSGYGNESERNRGRLAGFDYHLLKPVEPRLLKELLSRVTRTAEFATAEGVKQEDGASSETPSFPEIVSAGVVSGNPRTGLDFPDKKNVETPCLI